MRRARAELGVTAWGMQVVSAAAGLGAAIPNHNHDRGRDATRTRRRSTSRSRARRTLVADEEEFVLAPGDDGPCRARRSCGGSCRVRTGIRFVALGGTPGEGFEPRAWSELGAPPPQPPAE